MGSLRDMWSSLFGCGDTGSKTAYDEAASRLAEKRRKVEELSAKRQEHADRQRELFEDVFRGPE